MKKSASGSVISRLDVVPAPMVPKDPAQLIMALLVSLPEEKPK